MKKIAMLIMISSLLILSACNNDDDNKDKVNNPTDNNAVENNNANNNDQPDTNNAGTENNDKIPFSSFDLDVDYANFKSFEVEYDNEDDGMEAKIEDEPNNRLLRGDEAFSELQSRFEQFKFDQNTPTEEVLNEVIKSFDLKTDYKQIDLEITYKDGTEKVYQK